MCEPSQFTQTRLINQIESAATILLSPHHRSLLTPTELAQNREVPRSTIYRQMDSLLRKLERLSHYQSRHAELIAENHALRARISQLEAQLSSELSGHLVRVDDEKLALTVLELAARHNSVSDIQAAVKIAFELPKPPSDGTINNIIEQGSRLAEQILDSVEYHFPLDAIEFDELFHANSPIIAALEPYSMSLVLLHQFGDCKASTWKFGFDLLECELPSLMVHDCSMQGNAVVRSLGKISQLCVWHRVREIWREIRVPFEALQKKALKLEDEALWDRTIRLEESYANLIALTHSIDFARLSVRRYEDAQRELEDSCDDFACQLDELGLFSPSLSGLKLRAHQYLAHLQQWDRLAAQVVFTDATENNDGFRLLDAMAAVHLGVERLTLAYEEHGDSDAYDAEQELFLNSCERLRVVQSQVQNVVAIEKKFRLLVDNQVRTSSRIEALNRRLRGFTDAKRQVTERQLRLMQLHHNTTRFTADAKRAGKSPWEWLELDVAGLEDGFVGVLKAANQGGAWPSMWMLKS